MTTRLITDGTGLAVAYLSRIAYASCAVASGSRAVAAVGGIRASSLLAVRSSRPSSSQTLIRPPTSISQRFFSSSSSSSSSPSEMGSKAFMDVLAGRHSQYAIKDSDMPVGDARIKEIAEQTALTTPSAFNTQTTRIVLLFAAEHKKFWDYVLDALQPHIKPETKEATENRIKGFHAGHGTALFFTDPTALEEKKQQMPNYAPHFGAWGEHTNGMHQLVMWAALSADGVGASLQHYNPLIDDKAKAEWNIPSNWELRAQMPFGAIVQKAGDKPKKSTNEIVLVYGA